MNSRALETAQRRAIRCEWSNRGMSLLFNFELTWLAGLAGFAMKSWLVFLGAFTVMMWLRRFPIFCLAMCVLFTANWVFGTWGLSYFDNGWSMRTITLSVFTFVIVGWLHWRGLDELNDIYAR